MFSKFHAQPRASRTTVLFIVLHAIRETNARQSNNHSWSTELEKRCRKGSIGCCGLLCFQQNWSGCLLRLHDRMDRVQPVIGQIQVVTDVQHSRMGICRRVRMAERSLQR